MKPPPLQPPPTSQNFLNAVSVCSYDADLSSLQGPLGAIKYPAVSETGAWVVASAGDKLSHATYLTLKGATAQSDGSYVDTTGVRWWLVPNTPSSGWCENVAWT